MDNQPITPQAKVANTLVMTIIFQFMEAGKQVVPLQLVNIRWYNFIIPSYLEKLILPWKVNKMTSWEQKYKKWMLS